MKTFTQFIIEASQDDPDKEGLGHGTGMTHRGGEKIGHERKKQRKDIPSPHSKGEKPKARVKAIGGGKTAPAKSYKQRTDAGKQRPKGRASERLQQPEKERGSSRLSAREQQRKAALERRAAKSSGKNKKDLEKAATKLLTKKTKAVDPKYKPQKASGYTAHERRKIMRAGERLVRDIAKGKEKDASHYDPKK